MIRTFLTVILTFQLMLQNTLMATTQTSEVSEEEKVNTEPVIPEMQIPATLSATINQIEKSNLDNPPKGVNVAIIGGQERWIWNNDGTGVIKKYRLDEIDISMPEQSFVDGRAQLRIEVDINARQLLVHKIDYRRVGDKDVPFKTDTHVWNDVEATAAPIINDRFIYVAHKDGVRVIPLSLFREHGFNRPVPAFRALGQISPESGAIIRKIELLSPQTAPDIHVQTDGSTPPELFEVDDLSLTVEYSRIENPTSGHESPSKIEKIWVSRNSLSNSVLNEWMALLLLVHTRSPLINDPTALTLVSDFLSQYASDLGEQKDLLLAGTGKQENTVFLAALNHLADRSGLIPLLANFNEESKIANTPNDRFYSDPSEDKSWMRAYRLIVNQRRKSKPGEEIIWTDVLAQDFAQKIREQATQDLTFQRNFKQKMFYNLNNVWSKTVNIKNLTILSATLAGVYVLGAQGVDLAEPAQIWMTNVMSQSWEALTTATWNPQDFRDALTGIPKYLENGGDLGRLAMGALIYAPVYFSIMGLAWSYQYSKSILVGGKTFREGSKLIESSRWVLTNMMKSYIMLNRVMELPWKLSRQKNLYHAIDHKIPLTHQSVWNAPWASNEDINNKTKDLNSYINHRSLIKHLSSKLAAAMLVAEDQSIDVATLLQQESNSKDFLIDIATKENPVVHSEWMMLTKRVYEAAMELLNDQKASLDLDLLKDQYTLYQAIAKKLKVKEQENPGLAQKLKDRLKSSIMLGSKSAFVFFMGGSGRKLYRDLYNIQMGNTAARIIIGQGAVDLTASQLIWLGVDPNAFTKGDQFLPGEPRINASTVEQFTIWTGQNSTDVILTLGKEERNRPAKIGSRLHDPSRQYTPNENVRMQSLLEASGAILKGLSDPRDSKEKGFKDPLEAWQQYILNVVNGVWARTLVTGLPLFALTFLPESHGNISEVSTAIAASISTTIYILFSKFAVRTSSLESSISPGFERVVLGYADVWPVVTSLTSMTKVAVANNLKQIQAAASKLYEGIEFSNLPLAQKGAEEMLALYEKGGVEIPIELKKNADQFKWQDVIDLMNFSLSSRAPLPTTPNSSVNHIMNAVLGSVMSTILYNNVQKELVGNGGASLYELANIAGWIGLTYVAAGATNRYVVKPTLKGLRRTYEMAKDFTERGQKGKVVLLTHNLCSEIFR